MAFRIFFEGIFANLRASSLKLSALLLWGITAYQKRWHSRIFSPIFVRSRMLEIFDSPIMSWLPLCVSLFSHMVFRLTAEFWPLTYALLFEYNANLTWMCWKVKDTWVVVTYPGIFLVNSQFVMPLSWILTCTSQFHPSSTNIPARQIPTTNKKTSSQPSLFEKKFEE